MQHKKQEHPSPKILNVSSGIAKGLSGDALWNDVVASAGKYISTSAFGCFAAGTLVRVQRDLNLPRRIWKRIEDIQVGDLVLSRPEEGTEIQEYKPVVNTFKLEKKAIWLLSALELVDDFRNNPTYPTEVIATPNHPFWVCGSASISGELDSLELYDKGKWCRLDQLMEGDVIQSELGYFVIHFATPLYQTEQSHIAWAVDPENSMEGCGWNFDLEEIKQSGRIIGDFSYNLSYKEDMHGVREYQPYLADVYNFEVHDYHTYYVGGACIWVHNTNCGASTPSNNTVIKQGQDVIGDMEKTAKNVYCSSK